MEYANLRTLRFHLRATPLHPQRFVFRIEQENLIIVSSCLCGPVLDIGCADQKLQHFLPKETTYIRPDYYQTITYWQDTFSGMPIICHHPVSY